MRYQPYPRYTPSRVEWVGAIPSTWQELRLKFVGEAIIGLTYDPDALADEHRGTLVLRANNIHDRKLIPDDPVFVDVDAPERLRTKTGDILICSRNGSRDLIGKNAQVRGPFVGCYFGAFNTVFRSRANDFLFHVFNSSMFEFQSGSYLTSTINQLTLGALNSFVVPLPPASEQQQIAAFLDWKTGQIDALIARKQELLEKLKEKRSAVIAQAVTRGLNPAAPIRDSGVPWLGQVPAHWEVKRLKWAVMLQRGHDLPADERIEGEFPIVSSSGVSGFHDTAVAKAPGIVTGRYGTIGVFHLIDKDYWPLNTTLYSNDLNGNEPRFLRHMLEHISQLFLLNSIKSAVPGIDRNDVLSIPVAIPDLDEQIEIADHIDAEFEKLALFEEKVHLVIARLIEYRTALITAATTGKIDVRYVKIPEPAA